MTSGALWADSCAKRPLSPTDSSAGCSCLRPPRSIKRRRWREQRRPEGEAIMNILVAHNFYKLAGGEDQCVAAEIAMLQAHGHRVTQYYLSNDATDGMRRLELAGRTIWSHPAFLEMRRLVGLHRPQVVHFHNTFPLMSPAAYYAARAEGVPVVQTLHNFGLLCLKALLFRDGMPCEDCLAKTVPWRGVARNCYRDSRAASAAVAAMLTAHRLLGT